MTRSIFCRALLPVFLALCLLLSGCAASAPEGGSLSPDALPAYSGSPYTVVNDNLPYYTPEDYTTRSYESYSPLDALGRCGVCIASIGTDLMPTEERGSIGSVKPTGWQTVKYDIVDGKYLYNRCHLIGYQLTGENANERNLITGTRYLNVQGMLPFENMVADYIKETGNHVLYRATPVFDGENLLADGVLLEGYSIEDSGDGICFNVFCYNVQPGITLDYATGGSALQTAASSDPAAAYVLNTSSRKFHLPDCPSVAKIAEKNRQDYTGARSELIAQGYEPCKQCDP